MSNLNEIQQASRDQFQKQSANYGKSHILADVTDVAETLGDIAPRTPGSAALDVATGGGHTALFLARRGWKVTASDIAPAMLENARKLADECGLGIATRLHAAESLPYEDGTFELVSCRVAAHHFSDVGAFLGEVFRVLKPEGHFLLIDGSVPDGEPEAEEWLHKVEKFRDPSHGRFLSPSAWRTLCEERGLKVVRCETRPFKQPDVEWYFDTAATSPENQEKVRELLRNAPESVYRALGLAQEAGKTVWWWPRLGLVARKG